MRSSLVLLTAALALPAAVVHAQRPPSRDRAMIDYRTGMEEMRAEQWEKAAAAFRRAIEADPEFELAYYALGRASMPQKKYAEAVEALAKCRDLFQAQAGRTFSNQQQMQQARRDQITQIDELIRQYQSAPQTPQTAEAMRQLQDRRRQIQDYVSRGVSVSLEASVPSFVSLALGSAYFRLGRFADAEREYKATIATDPKTGEAHNNLAVVYLQTARYDEAEKSVRAAEKAGFKVHPMLKQDIAAGKKAEK